MTQLFAQARDILLARGRPANPTRDAFLARGRDRRLDWVDIAKGICIMLVVLMHSALGVEKAGGEPAWLHGFIDWAHPFRMPDFFLISGLFLAARIDRPWAQYLDTKVLHFAYFYVLWYNIQFVIRMPGMVAESGLEATALLYLSKYVQPFGTLWFIYLLAVFFIAAKLMHCMPRWFVLAWAAALHLSAPHTGSIVIDEFCERFVFFYTGYAAAGYVMAYAGLLQRLPVRPIAGALLVWAALNGAAVAAGIDRMPVIDLVVSYVGIAAVVATSVLLSRGPLAAGMAYCGRHSIVIYLAFTLFMAPVRSVLLRLLGAQHADVIGIVVACASIAGALLLRRAVSGTPLRLLFVRPGWCRMPRSLQKQSVPDSRLRLIQR